MKYDEIKSILESHANVQIPLFLDIEEFTDDLDIAYQLGIDTGKAALARDLLEYF